MATTPQNNLSDAHTERPALAGRRIAITGGTTGIGRAIAVLLASEGARVFVCGRDEAHLADALARIREVGQGDGVSVDLSRREDVPKFFDAAEAGLGGLDAVVINQAVPAVGLDDAPEPDIAYQTATNFTAYLLAAKAASERLGEGADIVFIGSMSAVSREPGSSVYVAAKTGIEGFAQALRKELAERNIKVGLVEPGLAGSDLQYPDIPADKQREMIHQETMLRAEDIAVSVQFMLTQPRRATISLVRIEPRVEAQ
ncbi:SDR family oxidoreductase [Novosphingobium huizhouense]|uniref:SDR family oxidoreductase n=1 Tax=Novosphingobium huizhouense TaxID=2866625 RepID=UPI001CD8DB63|nr:SDR family oxidoreductase [Novosphingobium huizhouense]